MILYAVQDSNGNEFELNGNSIQVIPKNTTTYIGDSFSWDNRTVENSFLPGDIEINEPRLQARNLDFIATFTNPDSVSFRNEINDFILNISKAKFLIDKTNSIRASVARSSFDVQYQNGTHKSFAEVSFTFLMLTPYWEDSTLSSINDTLVSNVPKEILFNNNGYLSLLPIIIVTVGVASSFVDVQLDTQSLRIEDSIFGTSSNEIMTIDNEQGLVIIGQFNRTISIVGGLGFLEVPVGQSTFTFLSPQDATIEIQYRERYYV